MGLCAVMATPATAQQMTPEAEFICIHGAPVSADTVQAVERRIRKAMDVYLALSPASSTGQIESAFSSFLPTRWQDGDEKVPLDQLAPRLVKPVETPHLVVAVVGGDNFSSRTIWAGRDANGPVFYEVDFQNGTFIESAAIVTMRISHGPTPPDTPPAYCHISDYVYSGDLNEYGRK